MIFAMEIDAMHIVPGTAVEFLARTMPWFELVLGVLLVIGIQMRYVASVATAVLAVFFTTLLVLYLRGFPRRLRMFLSGPGEAAGSEDAGAGWGAAGAVNLGDLAGVSTI